MGQTASTSYSETQRAPAAACPPAERALHEEFPTKTLNTIEYEEYKVSGKYGKRVIDGASRPISLLSIETCVALRAADPSVVEAAQALVTSNIHVAAALSDIATHRVRVVRYGTGYTMQNRGSLWLPEGSGEYYVVFKLENKDIAKLTISKTEVVDAPKASWLKRSPMSVYKTVEQHVSLNGPVGSAVVIKAEGVHVSCEDSDVMLIPFFLTKFSDGSEAWAKFSLSHQCSSSVPSSSFVKRSLPKSAPVDILLTKEKALKIALDEVKAEFDRINATPKPPRVTQHHAALQGPVVLDEVEAFFFDNEEDRELSRRPTLEGNSDEASVAAAAAAKHERALEIDAPRHDTPYESALELQERKRAAFEKRINEQHGCEEGFISV